MLIGGAGFTAITVDDDFDDENGGRIIGGGDGVLEREACFKKKTTSVF